MDCLWEAFEFLEFWPNNNINAMFFVSWVFGPGCIFCGSNMLDGGFLNCVRMFGGLWDLGCSSFGFSYFVFRSLRWLLPKHILGMRFVYRGEYPS